MVYAPPGTALYYQRSQGWTVSDHHLAEMVDTLHALVWMKTKDAYQDFPQHRPEPIWRPGMKAAEAEAGSGHRSMTASEYAEKAGITVNWE